jgi:hypothetical protein
MIRELAENPNVHQPMVAGRRLVTCPRGRYVLYLADGTGPHAATVQRVRAAASDVADLVNEIRTILRAEGRTGAEWELGESCTPPDLVARLATQGVRHDPDEPFSTGMVLEGLLDATPSPGVTARRVASVEELLTARGIMQRAFGGGSDTFDLEHAMRDYEAEGDSGSTFLGFVDGLPAAAGYAAYTPLGLLLFGGATEVALRGRGAYRAVVAARASEAAERGTPVIVTHAGKLSRPILERLGFTPVCRIDRLLDVLDAPLDVTHRRERLACAEHHVAGGAAEDDLRHRRSAPMDGDRQSMRPEPLAQLFGITA